MDLKRVIFVLFRYKFAIAAFLIASGLAASSWIVLSEPSYEASAQILVKVGREISAPSQDIIGGAGFVRQKRREDIFAEVEILESLHVLEQVVAEIGPDAILGADPDEDASEAEPTMEDSSPKLTPDQRALIVLDRDVIIQAVIRSDTIRMHYSNADPDTALLVIDTLLAKYLERHIEVHKGGHMDVVFEPQVEHYGRALSRLEDQIDALEREEGVFSLETQRNELIHQMVIAQSELEETRRRIATQEPKILRIKAQIDSSDGLIEFASTLDAGPGIDILRARIVELELKHEEAKQSSIVREIAAVSAELARAKELLAEEQQRVIHLNEIDLADLKRREVNLEANIESYQDDLRVIDEVDYQRSKLERNLLITEQNYLLYVGELEQARISAAMDLARITNVRVIQPATVDLQRGGTSPVLVALTTLVLSFFLSVAATFLLNYLDHSIKSSRDIEVHLGLPVLGSITVQSGGDYGQSHRVGGELVHSPDFVDDYEELADSVFSIKARQPLQTLAVASSISGEGASTVAMGLAMSLAESGAGNILLVDGNLRNPSLGLRMELEGKPGLTNLCLNGADPVKFAMPSDCPGLSIVSSGDLDFNRRQVFASEGFKTFMEDMPKEFSLVIIDSPPINESRDASMISMAADGLLLVVEAERANYEVIDKAQVRIASAGGRIIGTVLNRRRYYIPEVLYRRL